MTSLNEWHSIFTDVDVEREFICQETYTKYINNRLTKYNDRLPEGVLTPSKLVAYENLNSQIDNEKKTTNGSFSSIATASVSIEASVKVNLK